MIQSMGRRINGGKIVFAGVSAFALMISGAAFAQQAAKSNGVEEIIVTVQRRSERMQDVPVAMTSTTGAQLQAAGITNLHDMVNVTSGVIFSGGGLTVNPSVRGVFSSQTDPGNDGNTALYIDGIYQANQIANNMDLPDVSRIEVLKGPQGTLFGRNAAGGAIRVFTRDPDMEKYNGLLDVSYARFNDANIKAFVGGPIIADKLAASVSANYEESDGYYKDIVHNTGSGGTKNRSVRTKFIATPTDDLKIQLTGAYTYHKDNEIQAYNVLNGSTTAFLHDPNTIASQTPYQYSTTYPSTLKSNSYSGGLKISYETSIGEFSSTTSMNHIRGYYDSDSDITATQVGDVPAYQVTDDKSEELDFASKKFGDFQATTGLFYYHDDGRYDPIILHGPIYGGALYGYMRQITKAYAGFGELNWTPTDRITVIGGLRYSHEERDATGGYFLTLGRPATLPLLGAGKLVNHNVSPRGSIRYRLTEADDNVYFTYSQGFKSGGYNLSGVQTTPYQPEKVTAYELGLKTSPQRLLSANLEGFYYNYQNQQVSQNNGFTNVTANAASDHIYGIDGDIIFRATDELTFTSGLSWLHARFVSFKNAAIVAVNPSCPAGITPGTCGYINTTTDLSGFTMPYAPSFTASLGANWQHEIAAGVIDLSAHMFYSAKFYYDNDDYVPQKHYARLNLRAQFAPAGTNFSLYAFVNNVTSTKYYNNAFDSTNGIGVHYAPPAVYGAGVKYEF